MRTSEAAYKFEIPRYYLDYWRKIGILSNHTDRLGFEDLLKIRFILRCKKNKISLQQIKSLIKTQESIKNADNKWFNRAVVHGSVLLMRDTDLLYRPDSGQIYFAFDSFQNDSRVLPFQQEEQQTERELHSLEDKFSEAVSSRNSEAIKRILQEILKLEPEHTGALIESGNVAFEFGEFEDAIYFYELALKNKPDCVEAYYNVANIYFKEKKYAAAIRYFQRCIELDPEFPESYYNLAILYFNLSFLQEAILFFERYLELDPDSTWSDQARQFLTDIEQSVSQVEKEHERDLFSDLSR